MKNNPLLNAGFLLFCCSFLLIALLGAPQGYAATATGTHRITDTIPATDSLFEKWTRVTSFRAANGLLVGITSTGERVAMNRSDYLSYARKYLPKDSMVYDKTFTTLEFEPEYPGGNRGWNTYVKQHMHYPLDNLGNGTEGTVVLSFVVADDGTISDITCESGPTNGGLREEAMRLLKESGNWNPGIQNKRVVKACKKTTVYFRLRDLTSRITMP